MNSKYEEMAGAFESFQIAPARESVGLVIASTVIGVAVVASMVSTAIKNRKRRPLVAKDLKKKIDKAKVFEYPEGFQELVKSCDDIYKKYVENASKTFDEFANEFLDKYYDNEATEEYSRDFLDRWAATKKTLLDGIREFNEKVVIEASKYKDNEIKTDRSIIPYLKSIIEYYDTAVEECSSIEDVVKAFDGSAYDSGLEYKVLEELVESVSGYDSDCILFFDWTPVLNLVTIQMK